ncbi:MAG: hypothetical protein CVU57_06395 [Deltaproteobacteria bacterium HGW-Deltaproteobacteria-15]|nr:MAG: hypothetical protein CVU57_06395 [Deltaproteobacteria bacterium HGW-Deltaproteobacteria-15]
MEKKARTSATLEALRKQVERIIREPGEKLTDGDELDLLRLTHELEVQHLELELQNEDLRRASRELDSSRKEFYDLYESAPVAFVTVNEKGIIEMANRAAVRMITGSGDSVKGSLFSRLVYAEDLGVYFDCLKQLALNYAVSPCELRIVGNNGRLVHVQMEAAIKRDEKGVIHWCLTLADITGRKEQEAALRKAKDELEVRVRERTAELERKNKELQEFAFIASHDMHEPLRKIQTFGSMLEAKGGDRLGETEKDYIARITGAADRMREVLDALLRYSRVETKGEELRPTDLDEVVREAASDLEVQIGELGARVEIDPLPKVSGDPSQLRQLFQNLISNAIKYQRPGSKIVIRIHGEENDGTGRVFVEDHGIGFDEKYLDKIFQPFQRLHGRSEYQGVGIGLSICRKIVERHRHEHPGERIDLHRHTAAREAK